MKIKKFNDFSLLESKESHENPEEYVADVLTQIKFKIAKMFEEEPTEKTDEISFKKMGIRLESIEICNYSKMYDSLQVKWSDDTYYYNAIFMIKLSQAMNGKTPSEENIKKCFVKFRKYKIKDVEFIGKISKEIEIKDINKDLFINLKDELDKKYGGDEDELKIELGE